MAQSLWTRLDREQALRVLEQISTQSDAIVFSPDATEVSWRTLPFYTNYRLYRLTNYATMPTFSMLYLSNDEIFITVDGTETPIYTVNDKDPIHLTELNIIPYLEFFFNNVQGSDGEIFLIKDPHKMPFMDTLTALQQQSIVHCFRPLMISTDSLHNIEVEGTVYYNGGLMFAKITVNPHGKISFAEHHLLLTGIHFPDNPYRQSWLEG